MPDKQAADDTAANPLYLLQAAMGDDPASQNNEGHDKSVEMVATPPRSDDSTANGPEKNNSANQDGCHQIIRSPPHSQLAPSTREDSSHCAPRSSSSSSNAYQNWSCDDDNIRGGTNENPNNDLEKLDELAWKIISVVLKGWFLIWVLFAILVVTAELMSPQHSRKKVHNTKNIVSVEDQQLLLEISELIVSACSYSKLDTEEGREQCQSLCRNHMCCFIDGENEEFQSHKYSCADDPDKICSAYAGCEALVISEDDAVIFDADGVAVFGDSDSGYGTTVASTAAMSSLEQPSSFGASATVSATNSNSSSELQLIQQVVTSVCSDENLHTRHGMMECASLCDPSICCFDQEEIESLNPKMDLILKMEGIGDDILDRTKMGTCLNEEEEDSKLTNHFCQVHAGCKHVLLFGAPSTAKKQQTSLTGMVVTVLFFFSLMIGLTVYLLICKRITPSVAIEMVWKNGRTDDSSNDDFVPVEEMLDFV